MLRCVVVVATILACVTVCAGRRTESGSWAKEVGALPGLPHPPSFELWSGYAMVDGPSGPAATFFIYAAAAGAPSAATPVTLWLTGGPGCAGELAFAYENGPWRVGADGVSLEVNEYAWNTASHMIWIDAPQTVGFSYSLVGNVTAGDDATAAANLAFVLEFFNLFPHLRPNPFVISGESYGGVYFMTLLDLLVAHNFAAPADQVVRVVGATAGNPSTDYGLSADSYFPFMADHLLISPARFAALNATCRGSFFKPPTQACADLVANITATDLHLINPYDITALCVGAGPSPHGGCFTTAATLAARGPPRLGSQTFVPCLAVSQIHTYFNNPDVRAALHIAPGSAAEWNICSPDLKYVQFDASMIPRYQKLVGAPGFPGGPPLHVLMYSGDQDSCVNARGSMECVAAMAFAEVEEWAAWTYMDEAMPQTAGYRVRYRNRVPGDFTYATVRGASHLVPNSAPNQALTLFSWFLDEVRGASGAKADL